MSKVLDFSHVDSFPIKMRGNRKAVFRINPEDGENLSSENLKVNLGYNNEVSKTLTVGSGIVDNGDGSFTVTISPDDFKKRSEAILVIYGLSEDADQQIANAEIKYSKSL